jgi:putative oxidoreductase
MELGFTLQRLFSTFPSGWPGRGLLLLRLGVGIALIYLGINHLGINRLGINRLSGAAGEPITLDRDLIEAAGGIFLLAGLWTPIMGVLLALDELCIAFMLYPALPDTRLIHIFLAVLSAGMAMLGPGAWSIDARLFGRKRFTMADRNRGRKPSL